MKIKLIILCLFIFSFSSCTSNISLTGSSKDNIEDKIMNSKTDTILTSSVDLPQSTQANSSWIDAYIKVIESNAMTARHITLIDIDFDCIPELFLSQLGTSNSWIYHGFTYKNGKVSDITIADEFMPTNLELYRNKNTSEQFWVANGMFRDVSEYRNIWNRIDFSDLNAVKNNYFFTWTENMKGEEPHLYVTYTLIDSNGNGTEMTESEIYEHKRNFFSKYERIETIDMFSLLMIL